MIITGFRKGIFMKRYLLLALALFFAALNFNLILKPLELVTGGTQGLALLLHAMIPLKPSFLILIINIVTLVISYFCLSKETTYGTIAATFLYPFFVKITSFLPEMSIVYDYELISAIIAGMVCGVTGGYIYLFHFSSGGISTVNLLVNKYLKMKVALSNFLMNAIIIILGCFIFGIQKAFYSILVIIISSFLINRLLRKSRD